MKLLLATENQGKLREMRALLPGFELVLPSELGLRLDVEETGETFEDNARLKAENACRLSGLPSVADDSGLCVDALNGMPGVHSKRYGDENLSDTGRNELLLQTLANTKRRAAKFVSVIVCCFPNGGEITAHGECTGEITREPHGDNGFGYDPIFCVKNLNRTMAELSSEEKNDISHRGKAMRVLAEKLNRFNENMKAIAFMPEDFPSDKNSLKMKGNIND